jgi:hypothetical protein
LPQTAQAIEVLGHSVPGPLHLGHFDEALPRSTSDIVMNAWDFADIRTFGRDKLSFYGDRDILKKGLMALYDQGQPIPEQARIWVQRWVPRGIVLFLDREPWAAGARPLHFITVQRFEYDARVYSTYEGTFYERGLTDIEKVRGTPEPLRLKVGAGV